MALKRALTFKNISDAKIPTFDFTGEFLAAFGRPQRSGVWFIYGASGHGKTTFVLELMRELARFEKILFVSREMGRLNKELQSSIGRFGLLDINNKVVVVDDNLKETRERLTKRNSPNIVIIDSLNVFEIKSIQQVSELEKQFPNKTIIFIGWAEGNQPKGQIGKDVLYYANQKIFVYGYRAFSRGRSFGEKPYFTIWEEGAQRFNDFK